MPPASTLFAGVLTIEQTGERLVACLDDALSRAVSQRYAPGDVVFEQGETADRFFVLLHGRLRVTQVTAEGQQIVVRMVSPGDLFGIAKALQRSDYPGTATAVLESIAVVWPMSAWSDIIDAHAALEIAPNRYCIAPLLQPQQRGRPNPPGLGLIGGGVGIVDVPLVVHLVETPLSQTWTPAGPS